MNKEQAIHYLQSSGFSEEQVHTVIDAFEMPYRKAFEDIRVEIESIQINGQIDNNTAFVRTGEQVKNVALKIIDKHNPDKA